MLSSSLKGMLLSQKVKLLLSTSEIADIVQITEKSLLKTRNLSSSIDAMPLSKSLPTRPGQDATFKFSLSDKIDQIVTNPGF